MIYHYRNSNIVDESIVKLESTYTPKPNKNADSENICKELEHTKISLFKTKDNLHTLRKELDSLIRKNENEEIIIKLADKVQLSLLCRQITIGIYVSLIFQIHHITEC